MGFNSGFKGLMFVCTVHTYVPFLVKFGRPYTACSAECCLVEISKRTTVLARTDGITYTLCSVRPHDIFKLKCTAWAVRSSTYVLFIPPQQSWQPNPFTLWRHFLRMASLLLRRVALLWDVISEAYERGSVLFGFASPVPFITTLWNQNWIWLLEFYQRVLLFTNTPGTFESAGSEYCAWLLTMQSEASSSSSSSEVFFFLKIIPLKTIRQ